MAFEERVDATMIDLVKWTEAAILRLDSEPEVFVVSDHIGASLSGLRAGSEIDLSAVDDVLRAAQSVTRKRRGAFIAELAIPLTGAPTIDAAEPGLDALLSLRDMFEPPSLYVWKRLTTKSRVNFEAYKVPVTLPVTSGMASSYYAYFSCFRDQLALRNKWDLTRTLWFGSDSE